MQIMDAVREALRKSDRPQKDIAKAAGLHVVNLSQFKAGDRDLPLDTLCNLARVVGLEITVKKAGRR